MIASYKYEDADEDDENMLFPPSSWGGKDCEL
jgi:hypothetical protein